MRELVGDSARGADWALVRLRVEGDTIVDADAAGVAEDLRGLSLLEAAAVGGETLPVDALANALAPAVRAAPDPARVAVAMSGGVDSAVALLRAGPAAVGVTLRLWLDPRGPDSERACCSPTAVLAAREACHSLGLPHVTLDRRERFRRAVVTPFVRGYARGETPNPCVRCNGGFRFAELLAFARRIGAARLATGHYARIVERDGTPLPRTRRRRAEGPELHARATRAAPAPTCLVSARRPAKGRDARRGCAGGIGGGPTAGVAGGVLPRGRRLPVLPRAERPRVAAGTGHRRARDGDRDAPRPLGLHARPAARARHRRGPNRSTQSTPTRERTP